MVDLTATLVQSSSGMTEKSGIVRLRVVLIVQVMLLDVLLVIKVLPITRTTTFVNAESLDI